jgi:hypothetical protein
MEVGFIILGLLWAMNRNRQAEAQAQLEATQAAMTNNMHSQRCLRPVLPLVEVVHWCSTVQGVEPGCTA